MKSTFILIIGLLVFSCNRNKNRIVENTRATIDSSTTFNNYKMKELLKKVSITSIELGDYKFTDEQLKSAWLGNQPASLKNIEDAENRLNIVLPDDYKDFLKECNGFHESNAVEPSFLPADRIRYLKDVYPDLIEIWIETGNTEEGKLLDRSIIVGGIDEEQYFLLIPPDNEKSNWRYWKFANWLPGEEEYPDLLSYWHSVLKFNEGQIKKK